MDTQKDDRSLPEKRPVSLRKVEANRRNALKSTGPKTTRGKVNSRRNALKHGLSSSRIPDFEALGEDPQEFHELLSGISEQCQPVGRVDQMFVELSAFSYWRLKRGWRYENAIIREAVRRELQEQKYYCQQLEKVIMQLQTATDEINETGEVSQDTKRRICLSQPDLQLELSNLWSDCERIAREQMEQPLWSRAVQKLSPQELRQRLSMYAVSGMILRLKAQIAQRSDPETAIGQHAIPNLGLQRLLLYQAANERSLCRALDSLERLQRRRKEESLSASVTGHLTQ